MSPERKTLLVWWTIFLLFVAIAAYIKHNKGRGIQGSVTTVNPTSALSANN